MSMTGSASFAGRVMLHIHGGERGDIAVPWFDNMILDQGLDFILGGRGFPTRVFTGSSSEPVAATQTGVIAPLAQGNTIVNSAHGYDEELGCGWTRFGVRFARGVAQGNISELSFGLDTYGVGNTEAFCRTLVKDSGGNPTTITVLPDEVLDVYWELRRWWEQPANHDITYDDDGVDVTTAVTYPSYASLDKSRAGFILATAGGGIGTIAFAETSRTENSRTGVATPNTFNETSGNPSISTVNVTKDGTGQGWFVRSNATLTPPIAKTNEFTVSISAWFTVSRRNQ